MRLAIAVSALLVLPLATAFSQAAQVGIGAKVRVTSAAHGYNRDVATVSQIRGDTLVLHIEGKPAWVAVSDVDRIEASVGTKSTVKRNALLGGLVGFVGGAVLGAATYEAEDCDGCWEFGPSNAGEMAALTGSVFCTVGILVGAVVGVFNRTDRWEPARIAAGTISLVPARTGGPSLVLRRTF